MTHPAPSRRLDRTCLRDAQRVVVKVGSGVLSPDGRFSHSRLTRIVEQIAEVKRGGRESLLVTSGAVALGAQALGLAEPPTLLAERQACAAIGQSRLMEQYERILRDLGLVAAQVLLSPTDFDDRQRYLNLRSTLTTLLRREVIPIVNENDAVSVSELAFDEDSPGGGRVFGDNDRLSALLASKLEADLLVLLTDVDGLFDRDPSDSEARLIGRVDSEVDLVDDSGGLAGRSSWGRGGMASKVAAARVAVESGCHAVVAPGAREDSVLRILSGEDVGSWFPARARAAARRRWIAFAAKTQGALILDRGAVEAVRARGASLLAAGVVRVEGTFGRGDVVELMDENGTSVGRGIIHCNSDEARRWCEGQRPEGVLNHHALVHRDHLALGE